MNPDPTGTDPTGTDAPVTVTEIADFLQRLRALSRSSATTGVGAGRDATAERAVVLARKADLLARIAAQHPDLSPPAATPSAARPDGGRA